MAKAMTDSDRKLILKLLADHGAMTLATNRPDGYPQATTVGFASDGFSIYIGVGRKSQKARNLAFSDKVSATVDHDEADWSKIQGISLGGRAHAVTDPEELARVLELMRNKFPQIRAMGDVDLGDIMVFRIDPDVISLLDYTKGFGHNTLFEV